MSSLSNIHSRYSAYQEVSLGASPNTIARKLAANNSLYDDITTMLANLRGHESSQWMDLMELSGIRDQLALDKQVATDLLAAVRDEDMQYLSPGDLTQEVTHVSELLNNGHPTGSTLGVSNGNQVDLKLAEHLGYNGNPGALDEAHKIAEEVVAEYVKDQLHEIAHDQVDTTPHAFNVSFDDVSVTANGEVVGRVVETTYLEDIAAHQVTVELPGEAMGEFVRDSLTAMEDTLQPYFSNVPNTPESSQLPHKSAVAIGDKVQIGEEEGVIKDLSAQNDQALVEWSAILGPEDHRSESWELVADLSKTSSSGGDPEWWSIGDKIDLEGEGLFRLVEKNPFVIENDRCRVTLTNDDLPHCTWIDPYANDYEGYDEDDPDGGVVASSGTGDSADTPGDIEILWSCQMCMNEEWVRQYIGATPACSKCGSYNMVDIEDRDVNTKTAGNDSTCERCGAGFNEWKHGWCITCGFGKPDHVASEALESDGDPVPCQNCGKNTEVTPCEHCGAKLSTTSESGIMSVKGFSLAERMALDD